MNLRLSLCSSFTLAACVALAACSRPVAAPATSAPTHPAFAAIARGQVDVEGGMVRITAPRDGRISVVRGEPGGTVRAGELLAQIDPQQAQLAVDGAKAQLDQASAHAATAHAQATGLAARAKRAAQAAHAGAATRQAVDEAEQALAEARAQAGEADAVVEVARTHLKLAQHELAVLAIRAPLAARVVTRDVHLGDVVSPQGGTVLFTLLPDAPLIVRAEVNEAFVDTVRVGMRAEVVTQDGASKTYAATVTRVGDVFGPAKLADDPQEGSDSRDVVCILKVDANELRVGQRVQVRFAAR